MPLPTKTTLWPPKQFERAYRLLDEWSAWYSGDPYEIRTSAVGGSYEQDPAQATQSFRFWFRRNKTTTSPDGDRRYQLHIPLPGDIASTSADMLFSEPPTLTPPVIETDEPPADPEAPPEPAPEDPRADELHELVENTELQNRLLEAAEIAAAYGGVFLRAGWDENLADFPLLSVVTPDAAVPEFTANMLTGVTFWRVLPKLDDKDSDVWRHLERHEYASDGNGVILHGLYKGDAQKLGQKVELDAHPATAGLDEEIPVPGGKLAVEYIPNMRPARKLGKLPWGRSDFDGSEQIFDALDETWTSLMRDIRLGKARLIVPQEYLDRTGRGDQATFDQDAEIFTPIEMDPNADGKIDQVQFALRIEEHLRTAQELILRAINNAGHSPQSYGLAIEGNAPSGTALRIRERRSTATTARKQRYWSTPIRRIVETMLSIANASFGGGEAFMPDLEWADHYAPDQNEIAMTVQLWDAAAAASTLTKVMTLHPDWSEAEVLKEVARIEDAKTVEMPDLFDPESTGGPIDEPVEDEPPADDPEADGDE